MRIHLFCNDKEHFVGPFVDKFVSNVCLAIVASLKASMPSRIMRLDLDHDRVELRIDEELVELDRRQGFAHTIVRDTLRGMFRNLKGMEATGAIRIEMAFDEQKDQTPD